MAQSYKNFEWNLCNMWIPSLKRSKSAHIFVLSEFALLNNSSLAKLLLLITVAV